VLSFLDESFVVAICFIIFIYLAYRPVKKAILNSLDDRIKDIKAKLEETEKIKKDAKLLLEEIEQTMQNFEEQKKNILENAETSTAKLIETMAKEMDLRLERTKDSVIKSIDSQSINAGDLMRKELMNSVLSVVKTYLAETKNNSVSDEEILNHFLKK